MRIVIYDGSKPGYEVDLNKYKKDVVSFGRQADADIVFISQHVSRVHGCFFKDKGSWCIHDMGSTNGIKVNGVKVENYQLTLGDKIHLYESKSGESVYIVVKEIFSDEKTVGVLSHDGKNNYYDNNRASTGTDGSKQKYGKEIPKPDYVINVAADERKKSSQKKSIAARFAEMSVKQKVLIIVVAVLAVGIIGLGVGLIVHNVNKSNDSKESTENSTDEVTDATTVATTEATTETTTEATTEATEATTETTTEVTTEATTEATTEEITEDLSNDVGIVEPPDDDGINYDALYESVLEEYIQIAEHPDSYVPDYEEGRTLHEYRIDTAKSEFARNCQYDSANFIPGFAFYDIDGNGVKELIICEYMGDEVLAIYTIYDGVIYPLTGGWSRCYISLFKDGLIVTGGSGGAAYYYTDYYRIDKNRLVNVGMLYSIDGVDYYKDSGIDQEKYINYYYEDESHLGEFDYYYEGDSDFEFDKEKYKYEEIGFWSFVLG